MILAGALLGGCGSDGEAEKGRGSLGSWLFATGDSDARRRDGLLVADLVYFGSAAAEEPNATKAAEEVLKFGGTAADAAVALAFTLSVTRPSVASLGGGGICIVHDPATERTEVIDFIAPASGGSTEGRRPTAVPAMARGLAALHARYGQLDIRNLLGNAERLARFGFPVSRATVQDFDVASEALFRHAGARRTFAGPAGGPLQEGDILRQPKLADSLAQMRRDGIPGFYQGEFAGKLVRAVRAVGGTLEPKDLQDYAPAWRETIAITYRDLLLHVPPPPAGAGVIASQLWHMLAAGDIYRAAPAEERPHLFAEASKRAFALRGQWLQQDGAAVSPAMLADRDAALAALRSYDEARATPSAALVPAPRPVPENPASTGFVVVDLVGQAVACNLTNYNLFGAGLVAPGTGIVLAAAPGRDDRNPLPLGPLMMTERGTSNFRFAGAASGGPATATALVTVAAASAMFGQVLEHAIAVPRIHHSGAPDITLVERGLPDEALQSLKRRGHEVLAVPALGLVNAVECPLGLGVATEAIGCFVASDPRGAGLAVEAER